jgi:hypothetical protein
MDVLIRRHPLYTREWRAEALMLEPGSTRGFERAEAELQQGLFAVKTEERYDPSFSYRWDLVEAWLPDTVGEGRRLGRPAPRLAAWSALSRRELRGLGAWDRPPLQRAGGGGAARRRRPGPDGRGAGQRPRAAG